MELIWTGVRVKRFGRPPKRHIGEAQKPLITILEHLVDNIILYNHKILYIP